MTILDKDYYLEFLDETCECGQPLHIFPTISFMLNEDEN